MLNSFVPYALAIRHKWPRFFNFLRKAGSRFFGKRLGIYPRPLAHEIRAVTEVIRSTQWNMTYGDGLTHERLEDSFAEYLGGGYAIAVNTGGMALQMSIRGLGLRPGDEVIHQVDTCSATALAVINAGCAPLFADISDKTHMLELDRLDCSIGDQTRAIIATHIWGNVEDMSAVRKLASGRGLLVIEDSCLALGAVCNRSFTGTLGDVGVFSFGSLKPIQGGEGGMIFTRNEALARELRSMRHWGDRTREFGVRDTVQLAWNGRMSEIVAAVVREQLIGYPAYLRQLRERVSEFAHVLTRIDGLSMVYGATDKLEDASFTQVVLRLDEKQFGWEKATLLKELSKRGVQVRHANFEPINSLSFFKNGNWQEWLSRNDQDRVAINFSGKYPNAQRLFESGGFGLGNINFLSKGNFSNLIRQIEVVAARRS